MFNLLITVLAVLGTVFFNGCIATSCDNVLKDGVYLAVFNTFRYIPKNGDIEFLAPNEYYLKIKEKIDLSPQIINNMLVNPARPKGFTRSTEDIVHLIYKSGKSFFSISMGNNDYEIIVRKVVSHDKKKAYWPGGEVSNKSLVLITVNEKIFKDVYKCLQKAKKSNIRNRYLSSLKSFVPSCQKTRPRNLTDK